MSNKIFLTGDTHGDIIERLSFTHHPGLRTLDATDVLVILGDIGIMWPNAEKAGKYTLDWLEQKPFNLLFIRGNHDVVPWWESCPSTGGNNNVRLIEGDLRQASINQHIYQNIFLVTSSCLLDINGENCLCIGGAKSTDANNLVYPHEKERIKRYKYEHRWTRIIGKSWWPDEGININYLDSLIMDLRYQRKLYVNHIFSHQSPASFCSSEWCYRDDRMRPNEEQNYLERLKTTLKFDDWFHGHQHINVKWDDKCRCLYEQIYEFK